MKRIEVYMLSLTEYLVAGHWRYWLLSQQVTYVHTCVHVHTQLRLRHLCTQIPIQIHAHTTSSCHKHLYPYILSLSLSLSNCCWQTGHNSAVLKDKRIPQIPASSNTDSSWPQHHPAYQFKRYLSAVKDAFIWIWQNVLIPPLHCHHN